MMYYYLNVQFQGQRVKIPQWIGAEVNHVLVMLPNEVGSVALFSDLAPYHPIFREPWTNRLYNRTKFSLCSFTQ